MSKGLMDLNSLLRDVSQVEEVFNKELQLCYREASRANGANDTGVASSKLSQALVWERLLKAISKS